MITLPDPTPLDFLFVPIKYTGPGEIDYTLTVGCERSPDNLGLNLWCVPDEDGREWQIVGFDYGRFGRAEFGPVAYLPTNSLAGVHQLQRMAGSRDCREIRATSAIFLLKQKYDQFLKAVSNIPDAEYSKRNNGWYRVLAAKQKPTQ